MFGLDFAHVAGEYVPILRVRLAMFVFAAQGAVYLGSKARVACEQ
jgi:hypothetical protein